ncbi:hypothetical protein MBANPS3_001232 [Mucor bainieri]
MPYQNFELKTKHCKIQVWHKDITIKNALQSIDALSFLRDRPAIKRILHSICSSGSFSLALFGIAGPTLRFNEFAVCYNMTDPVYLEIVSELYRALDVDVQRCMRTDTTHSVCNSCYDKGLERYTGFMMKLKKHFHARVGAYDRKTFEDTFGLTWNAFE